MVWQVGLDSSSVFSSPICHDQSDSLFVTTLAGGLFCLDKFTGEIIWSISLDKPVFTSPIVNSIDNRIFVGTCGGSFYCIDCDGKLVNFF